VSGSEAAEGLPFEGLSDAVDATMDDPIGCDVGFAATDTTEGVRDGLDGDAPTQGKGGEATGAFEMRGGAGVGAAAHGDHFHGAFDVFTDRDVEVTATTRDLVGVALRDERTESGSESIRGHVRMGRSALSGVGFARHRCGAAGCFRRFLTASSIVSMSMR
jgi:hypothetical protein